MSILAIFLAFPFFFGHWAAAAEFPLNSRRVAETRRFSYYQLRFPSPHQSPFPQNDEVWGHLYVPSGLKEKPPAALVLPIMAAPNAWIEQRFIDAFLRRGIAVMWLEMPYQFHRRPHPSIPSGAVFLARSAKRLAKNFRQSRADAGRALEALERTGLVDSSRLGVFGISLGALVGSSFYSIDERPKGAVFLLGGAGFVDLVAESEMTAAFLKAAGIRRGDLEKEWVGLDPLERKSENGGKKVFLVNAKSDRVIPAENGRLLKEAFPEARQLWVPGGHYSAILHLLWMPACAASAMGGFLD